MHTYDNIMCRYYCITYDNIMCNILLHTYDNIMCAVLLLMVTLCSNIYCILMIIIMFAVDINVHNYDNIMWTISIVILHILMITLYVDITIYLW